jgi:hypothetical protein
MNCFRFTAEKLMRNFSRLVSALSLLAAATAFALCGRSKIQARGWKTRTIPRRSFI